MKIDWLSIVAVIGTIGTIVGLVLTIVYAHRADRRKALVYDVAPPLALATVLPERTEHRLSILYEREGYPPLNVKGAYLRFIQLGNLGKEPIRLEDIAHSDPLRLEVAKARVLDMAVSAVSRDVINFHVASFTETSDGQTNSLISFDFLDSQDGAVIRVITDNPTARFGISGTIIGMPQGILQMDDLGQNKTLNAIGCSLAVLLQLSTIAGALFVFRTVTGSWSLLWVFLLPLAALFLPGSIVAIVISTIWPNGPKWPKALNLPNWFVSAYSARRDIYRLNEIDAKILATQALLDQEKNKVKSRNNNGA